MANKLDPCAYKYIANYSSLAYLDLTLCGVVDADIENLVKLQQLKRLRLARTHITGKALALIKNMKALKAPHCFPNLPAGAFVPSRRFNPQTCN